ncbi:MAG: hypothetical protein Q8R78_07155 [Candidatus Omnitrophota bacterium]|nr:hypothetical protein [Candidatus Omnitrophota bacterium]
MSRVTCYVLLVALFCAGSNALAATPSHQQIANQLSEAIEKCRGLALQGSGYDAVFRRDPMRALVDSQGRLITSAGLHGGFSVEGIIWSPDRPLAVIDDELFAKGDTVGPYTIRQIRQDGVVVQRGNDFVLIPLDRGIETQVEQEVDPLSLLSLPEDVPVPLAPRRSQVSIPSSSH